MLRQHTSHVYLPQDNCYASKLHSQTENDVHSSLREHHTTAAALRSGHVDTRGAHLAAAKVICVVSVVDSRVDSGACTATVSLNGEHMDRADHTVT